ncbi:hypothetical protein HY988_06885 [Candidatus Micrarchaeota archaeon]|nr:hypothetical protein [Candidatus Micrarchaeota archaeon]
MGLFDLFKNFGGGKKGPQHGPPQTCPNCKTKINLGMERCPGCGVRIKSMFRIKCPKCGTANEIDVKKCTKCQFQFDVESEMPKKTYYLCPICNYRMEGMMTACPACNARLM